MVAIDANRRLAAETAACYHCGLSLPVEGGALTVQIDGSPRPMCCTGCQAVAQAIVGSGLSDYYRHRDALPESPREALPAALCELGLFDHPDFQAGLVQRVDADGAEHERETSLILEGITCAACVWLNEAHLARQPGVTAVSLNYATRRARVRWDERRIRLSDILASIAAIGYRAYPYDPRRSEQIAQRERRSALWRVAVAGLGMMQVMMYAVPSYLADEGSMTPGIEQLMRWASLLLTLPVVLYSAAPFFRASWRDLRLGRVGMDLPVALGVGAAFLASLWATVAGAGEVYFDSVTMFVFFLLGGRYLELMARQKAVRGVEQLGRAIPAFTTRYCGYPDSMTERVPVLALVPGEVVLVRPGEVVPADGTVLDGSSTVDESLLTGEAKPCAKAPGDAVTGGTVNRDSPLSVRVRQTGEGTRLASIQRLMERAAAEKPRLVELADRTAAGFVVVILVIAAGTALYWWWAEPSRALPIFVAVLVVSCPCALSLATPAALTVATGALSRLGVLVARGHAIEVLARATHFVFDKTGTLTRGRLRLVRTEVLGAVAAEAALSLAATLEQASEHAVGAALRDAAAVPAEARAEAVRSVAGQGIEGRVEGRLVRLGRLEFVQALNGLPPPACAPATDTLAALGDENGWLALFHFDDTLRPEAPSLLERLRAAGRRTLILSGDTQEATARVAALLGVQDARGGCSPEDKHETIVRLQREGAVVAMAGDGINDAPVLAQAQVSIAMGGGTDLARAQADIVLLNEDLGRLGEGIGLAVRTIRIIRQNLIWAFVYNVAALPLATAGYIAPWMAGIGMSASSLLVVLNALRLQGSRQALAE